MNYHVVLSYKTVLGSVNAEKLTAATTDELNFAGGTRYCAAIGSAQLNLFTFQGIFNRIGPLTTPAASSQGPKAASVRPLPFEPANMTKRRVIAYVDGFNFYYRRLRNGPYRWLDLCKLFEQIFPEDELVQVRYFTARVGGKFDPSKPLRQQAYLKALQTLPRVSIIEGKFLTTQVQFKLAEQLHDANGNLRNSAKVWKQDEKGSDVNLGSYLLNEAWEDAYDVAAVLTNDSDLATPIRMAVKRGKTVIVLHPDSNPARSLETSASGCLYVHDTHLSKSQLPEVIRLDNGKVITKPHGF